MSTADDPLAFTSVPTTARHDRSTPERQRAGSPLRRGRDGWLSPVTGGGKIVGHRHRFDNRLLFAACYGEPMSHFDKGLK